MASTHQDAQTKLLWVWSPESDVHAVADINLFTEYTEYASEGISTWVFKESRNVRVVGIGTIEASFVKGDNAFFTVMLTDVLHVPDLGFNSIGNTEDIGAGANAEKETGYILDCQRNIIACLRPLGNKALNFWPQQCDPSTGLAIELQYTSYDELLREYQHLLIWERQERERWKSHARKATLQYDESDTC
ncbi:hypothetical protein F5B22DRAFT_644237 [Xylaria bambusicola]|uniref:uncharacterized protein n=1 Tax=Xylaria bambusicola TaxID=326684 RepID=UPI0020087A77|nr:uncharacterized protein F5B22DRAFT_644237 [Xylaria bambusicola]KAI0520993.1 hypothetical protein F5B22DRAFT_644237 [Xylaria bambusicola]